MTSNFSFVNKNTNIYAYYAYELIEGLRRKVDFLSCQKVRKKGQKKKNIFLIACYVLE